MERGEIQIMNEQIELKNELQIIGVLSKGYGIMPKMVALDEKLSIESKAIYAFLTSFSGVGQGVFPSVDLILHYLKISEKRYYKYRKELIQNGYITVKPRYCDNKRISNVYILNMEKIVVSSQFECVQNESVQNESVQIVGTNNNNLNNNNLNNNNIQQQLSKIDNVLVNFKIKDRESIKKYCIENNVDVDVVAEKLEILKNIKKIRNKVGALLTAIKEDWKPSKVEINSVTVSSFNNFEAREYDYDSLEKKLLGWD